MHSIDKCNVGSPWCSRMLVTVTAITCRPSMLLYWSTAAVVIRPSGPKPTLCGPFSFLPRCFPTLQPGVVPTQGPFGSGPLFVADCSGSFALALWRRSVHGQRPDAFLQFPACYFACMHARGAVV